MELNPDSGKWDRKKAEDHADKMREWVERKIKFTEEFPTSEDYTKAHDIVTSLETLEKLMRDEDAERIFKNEFPPGEIVYVISGFEECKYRDLEVAAREGDKDGKTILLEIHLSKEETVKRFGEGKHVSYYLIYPTLRLKTGEISPEFPKIIREVSDEDVTEVAEETMIAEYKYGSWKGSTWKDTP